MKRGIRIIKTTKQFPSYGCPTRQTKKRESFPAKKVHLFIGSFFDQDMTAEKFLEDLLELLLKQENLPKEFDLFEILLSYD